MKPKNAQVSGVQRKTYVCNKENYNQNYIPQHKLQNNL